MLWKISIDLCPLSYSCIKLKRVSVVLFLLFRLRKPVPNLRTCRPHFSIYLLINIVSCIIVLSESKKKNWKLYSILLYGFEIKLQKVYNLCSLIRKKPTNNVIFLSLNTNELLHIHTWRFKWKNNRCSELRRNF